MLRAISRYGARVLPNTQQLIAACRSHGELIQGPAIDAFENEFAKRLGAGSAVSASYGRMAFYYILKALDLPPGSEIIFPALTFWVVPEMARVLGHRPVFVDVDPGTFNIDASQIERAITDRTRAIVPTHLYGLPCDMDRVLDIADRHGLAVIEDCAHALGAEYRGRSVGTLGDAALFSFQTLKPLNTYGGGMAVMQRADLGRRVAEIAQSEPWPTEKRVLGKLFSGRVQRIAIRPSVFPYTLYPVMWAASFFNARPDVYLWESIRPLDPLPPGYAERYSNVQATLGLEALQHLDRWTGLTRRHAAMMSEGLRGLPGVCVPYIPADRTHVFYQYCLYAPDRDALVRRSLRLGLDVETLHVDVCTRLELFREFQSEAPGADCAAEAVQLPVYSDLTDEQVAWAAETVKRALV